MDCLESESNRRVGELEAGWASWTLLKVSRL